MNPIPVHFYCGHMARRERDDRVFMVVEVVDQNGMLVDLAVIDPSDYEDE